VKSLDLVSKFLLNTPTNVITNNDKPRTDKTVDNVLLNGIIDDSEKP
jgi:hypothetical protein